MYTNPFSSGYEVLRKTSSYSIACGDLSASATHLINNDFPEYAGMFYQPSEHEVISSIRYKQVDPGYDSNLREIQESMQGRPMEFYIPQSISVPDGVGKEKSVKIMNPFKEVSEKLSRGIISEIERAQQQVRSKQLIFREVQIEDTLILKRKIRKREVVLRYKDVK